MAVSGAGRPRFGRGSGSILGPGMLAGVLAVLLVACAAERDQETARPSAPSSTVVALACGSTSGSPNRLGPDLVAVRDTFVEAARLPTGTPYPDYRVACGELAATGAEVPASWRDSGRDATNFTAGPDLLAPVDTQPVVGVQVARYVGEPISPQSIIEGAAEGSLENGQRQPPRRGATVLDGCAEGPSLPFAHGGYTGETQLFVDCDDERRGWLIMAAYPDNGDKYQIQVIGQALTSADADALVRTLGTVRVDEARIPGLQLPPLPLPTETPADPAPGGQ